MPSYYEATPLSKLQASDAFQEHGDAIIALFSESPQLQRLLTWYLIKRGTQFGRDEIGLTESLDVNTIIAAIGRFLFLEVFTEINSELMDITGKIIYWVALNSDKSPISYDQSVQALSMALGVSQDAIKIALPEAHSSGWIVIDGNSISIDPTVADNVRNFYSLQDKDETIKQLLIRCTAVPLTTGSSDLLE